MVKLNSREPPAPERSEPDPPVDPAAIRLAARIAAGRVALDGIGQGVYHLHHHGNMPLTLAGLVRAVLADPMGAVTERRSMG